MLKIGQNWGKIANYPPNQVRHLLHNFVAQFPLGGLFSFFHQKSASKAPKTCDFAYFTGQWGVLEPPRPPGYATAPNAQQRLVPLNADVLQRFF